MSSSPKRLLGLAASLSCAIVLLMLASTTLEGKKRKSAHSSSRDDFNVILISVDTLRADRLGCYGYEARESSPNVDTLARDGILVERFISASPWTTPAHASMLTSLQPVSHGLTMSFGELWSAIQGTQSYHRISDSQVTLAEALKQSGFVTAAFTAGGPLAPSIGFDQGFDEYHTSMYKLNEENVGQMLDWIERNRSHRFFLFWHHFEVHAPYLHSDFIGDVLPEDQAALVRSGTEEIRKRQVNRIASPKQMVQARAQIDFLKEHGHFTRDVCESLYVGGVRSADRWLGRLVGFLRDHGLYDRTLIIFTSDHGEEFSDRDPHMFYNIHGHILYDEMVHVPLILKLPDQRRAGSRVAQVTRMIDLMPTVLDLVGVRPEPDKMQGISLARYWTRKDTGTGLPAVTECCARFDEKKSVRTDRYKYIVSVPPAMVKEHGREYLPEEPPGQELYDLANDPGERKNLLEGEPAQPVVKLAKGFYRQLRTYLDQSPGRAEPTELDEETIEKLKSLGYAGK